MLVGDAGIARANEGLARVIVAYVCIACANAQKKTGGPAYGVVQFVVGGSTPSATHVTSSSLAIK